VTVERIERAVTRLLSAVLGLLMAGLVLTVFLQVFSRYVLGSSISWTEELARYFLVYLTFIGSAVAVHERAHLRVDFIVERLPQIAQKVISLLSKVGVLVAAAVLLYYGARFTSMSRGTVSPALNQSIAWVYLAMPITGLLMILYTLPQLIGQLLHWDRAEEPAASDVPAGAI
jgi:TRAP-type C4-dicarboxylate transport system permease small subunit